MYFAELTTLVLAGVAVAASLVAVAFTLYILVRDRRHRSPNTVVADAWNTRVRQALDVVPDWVLLVQDGRIVDSNQPAAPLLEDAGHTAVGKSLDEVFPAKVVDILKEHIQRVLDNKRDLTFDFLFQDDQRYAECRCFPLTADLVLVVCRDLTNQKAREETLHKSKERFALAIQGANDGLWDWDLDNDEVYYSYQWKLLLGYRTDQPITTPDHWFSRIHPDDRPNTRAALEAHLSGELPRFESEHRIAKLDGTWNWVLARGMAVRDARGMARRIAGSLTDLTNRRVVAASQEKANLLEHATEAAGIGIAVIGPDQGLMRAGHQLQRMTVEWVDLNEWWEACRSEHVPPATDTCPECQRPHSVGTVLAEVYRPQTGAFPVGDTTLLSRVFEIAYAGHAHEIGAEDSHVLLIKDVTARTRAERKLTMANEELVVARDQALAASRAKSSFLANMSHELRTPLNHILGYAEMVGEEVLDAGMQEAAKDVSKILSSGHSLLDMITDVLDMSRVEAGFVDANLELFDVRILLETLAENHRESAESRGNTLSVSISDDLAQMNGSQKYVQRILKALLSNAVKFTENGAITLSATTANRGGKEWVVFEVEDTGVGMRPEVCSRLFDGFHMADASATRSQSGAGIGLTLAHRFTDMMGGSIDVQSEEGAGTCFQVSLLRDVTATTNYPDTEIDKGNTEGLTSA